MLRKSLFVLLFWPVVGFSQGAEPVTKANSETLNSEWVLVFNDPRPARLQGWLRDSYGKSSVDYSAAPELERFGNKLSAQYDMELRDQWFIPSLKVYCLIVSFNGDQIETISNLKKDARLQWLQPSNEFKLLNQLASSKAGEMHDGNQHRDSRLPSAINGKGVVIAIVDSAVDGAHQDLIGAVDKNADFVVAGNKADKGELHGTAIAGVMVANPDTRLGVAGVAPGVKIEAYRGCWEQSKNAKTHCNTLSLARALDAVTRGKADILNLSLSGPKDVLLDRLLQQIIDRGTMVVAAFDPDRVSTARFPSQRDGVLIVRAKGLDQSYTNIFSAPGARIVTRPANGYDYMHGHSVATAYTSALLALRKQLMAIKPRPVDGNTDWRNISHTTMAEELVGELLNAS